MGTLRRSVVRSSVLIIAGVFVLAPTIRAEGRYFSIAVKGSLTTTSQLFPNPNSPDEVQRAQFISLKDIWGIGVEVRYRFPETDLALALSADYLRTTQRSSIRLSGNRTIPVDDGYRVIPVELTGYFLIPLSGETIGVYMGGGGGAYFGRRVYRIGSVEAPSTNHGVGFGIHVLSGVSYRFTDMISAVAEMKFRDLQFTSVNQFSSSTIRYGSTVVPVSTLPFESRVHTDGIVFQLGIVIAF